MKKHHFLMTCILLMTMLLCMSVTAGAGFKKMPNGKYRYYIDKTHYLSGRKSTDPESVSRWVFKELSYKENRYTYCFDENGYMLTGVKTIYCQPEGQKAGWRKYRFADNGRLIGRITDKPLKGKFVKKKKGIKYRLPNKKYVKQQWKLIDGHWYYFYSTGYMAKNTMVGSHRVNKKGWKVS